MTQKAIAQAVRLFTEFRQLLEQETTAIRKMDFPTLEDMHARKGALRLGIEKVMAPLANRRQREHASDGDLEQELSRLRRLVMELMAIQRQNERLAVEIKERIGSQLRDLAQGQAAAKGYHGETKVSANHVDITK